MVSVAWFGVKEPQVYSVSQEAAILFHPTFSQYTSMLCRRSLMWKSSRWVSCGSFLVRCEGAAGVLCVSRSCKSISSNFLSEKKPVGELLKFSGLFRMVQCEEAAGGLRVSRSSSSISSNFLCGKRGLTLSQMSQSLLTCRKILIRRKFITTQSLSQYNLKKIQKSNKLMKTQFGKDYSSDNGNPKKIEYTHCWKADLPNIIQKVKCIVKQREQQEISRAAKPNDVPYQEAGFIVVRKKGYKKKKKFQEVPSMITRNTVKKLAATTNNPQTSVLGLS
ncbi:unnamed protein product [Cuscuta europaea]|uniref:Uncharacterized protein n=1 Tax=Cuscuta europaea TaxID=41803 RepID=A0A9P0ZNZ8_CUSEU|nr:unnamed protein product [Cuscuta europaea]